MFSCVLTVNYSKSSRWSEVTSILTDTIKIAITQKNQTFEQKEKKPYLTGISVPVTSFPGKMRLEIFNIEELTDLS